MDPMTMDPATVDQTKAFQEWKEEQLRTETKDKSKDGGDST